ncbi:T9SS type A sorting domain-containing protein, partial [candidate division KSB1 bacterium]|nr:T9SS type A sorting domain-containing protein [candidate division KSB1 bacterium]
ISKSGVFTIGIYDILGHFITNLIENEFKESGSFDAHWDGTDLPSGVYFYKIQGLFTDGTQASITKKILLLK